MIPTSLISLAIITVAVLPGSMYTWAFERQVSAYGANLADRVLRFVALSVLFHLALGWIEYWLFRTAFAGEKFGGGQFAIAWAAVALLVAVPASLGTVIGGLYASRSDREGWAWIRRFLTADNENRLLQFILGRTPAPRAWDNMFSERQTLYLRVETTDGNAVAGLFADKSYAGGFPHDADLYLEESWSMTDDGSLDKPPRVPCVPTRRADRAPRNAQPLDPGAAMSTIENKSHRPAGIEKKGGYSGSKPASSVPPPPKIPSATIRPAQASKPKG